MKRRFSSPAVACALLVGAYNLSYAANNPRVELADRPCPVGSIRVAVFSNGRVEVNGRERAVAEIPAALAQLVGPDSLACVHRENPAAPEPHPNMIKVLDAIIARQLPVAFFWDAKFQKRVMLKD